MYSLLYISLWSAGLPGLLAFPQLLDPRDGIAANPTGTMPSGSQGTGTTTPLSDLGPAYVSGGSCPGSGDLTSRSIHDLFARAPCQFSIENNPHPWHPYEKLPADSTASTEYLVSVKLGKPGQAFRLLLDTGSTPSWVNSVVLDEDDKHGAEYAEKRLFSFAQSHSNAPAEVLGKGGVCRDFAKTYGDSTYAGGYLYTMDVALKTQTLETQTFHGITFGLCTVHEGDFYTDKQLDGFLGFGIDKQHRKDFKKKGTFADIAPKLSRPILGASLNLKTTGYYDFGHIPDGRYSGSLHQFDTVPPPDVGGSYWQITKPSSGKYEISSAGGKIGFPGHVIIDTGFTGISLAKSMAQKYYKGVQGYKKAKRGNEDVPAHKCGDKLPDLLINIGDYSAKIAGSNIEGAPIKKTGNCEIQIIDTPEGRHADDAFLGTLFHQVTYVVYELRNANNPNAPQRVSFGRKKAETSTN